DLRNQSLFESGFGDTIAEVEADLQDAIWRVVERYSELCGRPCRFTPLFAYALTDACSSTPSSATYAATARRSRACAANAGSSSAASV
ncbi:TetR family transcriptional regulator, partial [Methylobacterium radiotolerans]